MILSNVKSLFNKCIIEGTENSSTLQSKIISNMNWILLILAGCLELVFTFCLGKINRVVGMEKYVWALGLIVSLGASMLLLIKVTRTLPVGTSYAIWTGIGAAGTVLIGIVFFKEPAGFARLFFIFTLICSIIGLKIVSH